MLLGPVIDLLKSQVADFHNRVDGAADFVAAQEKARQPRSAFVIPLADRAGPNLFEFGSIEQHVTERFGVILLLANKQDQTGKASYQELQTFRRHVIDALLGWQPSTDYDPVIYGGGRMLMINGAELWWQLDFITAYYERKV